MSWKLVRLVERGDDCISVRKLLSDSGLALRMGLFGYELETSPAG
jgi:hypothetical protein